MNEPARKFVATFSAGAAIAASRLWTEAQRLRSRQSGVAAMEFALILTLMLTIYFGVVVLAQGLEVGRKVQLLSHTLADLTTQTLPENDTSGSCTPVTSGGTAVDGVIWGASPA